MLMGRFLFIALAVALVLPSCGQPAQPAAVVQRVTMDGNVDGALIETINLWADPVARDKLVAQTHHGESVGLVRTQGESALVRTDAGKEGWVLKAYIKELR